MVRNTTNHYILNGNWKIDFAGSYDFAGTSFVYERLSPLGEKAKKTKNKASNCTRKEVLEYKFLDFVISLFVSVVARQQSCLDVRARADYGKRANIGGNLRCGELMSKS